MKPQQQRIYGERIFICPPLTTNIFTIMVVSQLLVRSHLTTGRVFKGDYSIGLTVLPLFFFFFSVAYQMFCKRTWRVLRYTDDSLGSDMNPRILNDGTPFFVKESAICTLVGIQEISAISFLSIISLKIAISMRSLLSKIWVEECTES